MAMALVGRTLISKPYITSIFSRSFSSTSLSVSNLSLSFSRSSLLRLRPLVAVAELRRFPSAAVGMRCFATRPTTSSLNDPSPNWNNRPPKETILLDGCDFEHWLIVMEKPEGEPTRDEIIDSYIKTLSMVLGSEEEARKSIYSVSSRYYYAFGCIVSEEISYKIKELPRVRWVLPDSYLDVKNKDYGGEPFINGQAVPYDPKYHEEWVRNNARANERSRRNDRPRNFDRSRNFERRRENMQNRDFQNRGMPSAAPNMPPNNPNMYNTAPNSGNMQNTAPNMGGMPPNPNMQNTVPNMGGMPPPNANMNMGGGMPNRDAGPNAGYFNPSNTGSIPNRDFWYGGGGAPYQSRESPGGMPNMNYQNNYGPNRDSGNAPPGNPYDQANRDMPSRDLPPMPNQQDYQ